MPEKIPQSVTVRVPLQAYLSSDHVSPATGKTIAITISKNGGAFANPSGGVTNAVEIASGSYYVDLSTTDTGTAGPLFILGTASGVDNVVAIYDVANAHNAGFDGMPNASAGVSGGVPVLNSALNSPADVQTWLTHAVTVDSNNAPNVSTKYMAGTALTGRDIGASVLLSVGTGAGQLSITNGVVSANATQFAGQTITCGAGVTVGAFVGNASAALAVDVSGRVDLGKILGTASVGTAGYIGIDWGHVNAPTTTVGLTGTTIGAMTGNTAQSGDSYARLGAPAGASVSADIAAIAAKTTALPASPADETLVINATTAIMARLGAPAGASVSADIAGVPTATLASTVDGKTVSKILQALKAFCGGKSSYTDNMDGTATDTFLANDGATVVISITYTKATGARTAVSIT